MNYAALVLAAGASTRFGSDKLAAPFRGEPLLVHALRVAAAAPVAKVIVVRRPGHAGEPLPDCAVPIETVVPSGPDLSDSLRAGVAAAGKVDGVFVFLADMPLVPHGLAARLADRFAADGAGACAVIPRCGGVAGHPVLLGARLLPLLGTITGDRGAGALLRARPDVAYVDEEDEGILQDADTANDLAKLAGTRQGGV